MHPLVKAAIVIAGTETGRNVIKKGVNWTVEGIKRHRSGKTAIIIQQAENIFAKHGKGKIANIFKAGSESLAKGDGKFKLGGKIIASLFKKGNTHS